MNSEYYLYQFLLKHNRAEVPDFGVFELAKESAKIDAENSIIIPPKEVITFLYKPDVFDNQLAKYIADETTTNLFTTQMTLKNDVAVWLQKLKTDNHLSLQNMGQFQLTEESTVIKIAEENDDIFGLESINLRTLKKTFPKKISNSDNYLFNKNVFWTFLGLIILGTTALFLFGDQQLMYGKSSQIPTKKRAKQESRKTIVVSKKDSIKTDSIKPTTNAKIQKINR